MSLQLRISSSQEKRPAYRGNTRHLLRLIDIPESPATLGAVCEAVETDGRPCRAALPSGANDPWCDRHHDERNDLNARWSKIQKEAERIIVLSLDVAKQKVMKLRQSVELRRQVRDRFYPGGGDIQDYIKWLGKLENDVRQLADSLLSRCYV